MQQRGSISFGLIVFLCSVGVGFYFVVDSDSDDDVDRPSVAFESVIARPLHSHHFGTSLAVEIELEVTSKMPHVAPHVIVLATCDGDATDDAWGFFQSLGNARNGDKKVDTVELFRVPSLERDPGKCDITLSLTEGATKPAHYCFDHGTTRAGRC